MPDFAKAMSGKHIPVLLKESIDALDLQSGETFLDGTYGAGGHTREVRARWGDKVEVIAIDQDPRTGAITCNFRDLDQVLHDKQIDAILFDLGISSNQLTASDGAGRGFSFLKDEPLDMRMSSAGITAAEILNSWDERTLELIIRGFGEEKFSRKIAREIVNRRSYFAEASKDKEAKAFQTTYDLVEAVLAVKSKSWKDKIHPATKTFQALRIATNEELTSLEIGLEKGFNALKAGGRFAVISFHSLEDRIVKNFFRERVKEGSARAITKKPTTPTLEELQENPRSRSAKLRVAEKI